MNALCIYCGSNPGTNPIFAQTAHAFGRHLAQSGITVVYGGGHVGLMGAVADGALAAGGRVIGVIPSLLVEKELAHRTLTELHVVASMHERKLKMATLSDAFVALPGGIGTLEEIFEVFTWTQLSIHAKACALLNVAGYYDHLVSFLHTTVTSGFLQPDHLSSFIIESGFEPLLSRLAAYEHTISKNWLPTLKADLT